MKVDSVWGAAPKDAETVGAADMYRSERILLHEAEQRVLGFDHQQVAAAVMQQWRFPVNLTQAVGCHHQPESADTARQEACVVHLADHLVNALQIGSSGERHVPPLSMRAWETLGLPTSALPAIVAGIEAQIGAVQEVFLN